MSDFENQAIQHSLRAGMGGRTKFGAKVEFATVGTVGVANNTAQGAVVTGAKAVAELPPLHLPGLNLPAGVTLASLTIPKIPGAAGVAAAAKSTQESVQGGIKGLVAKVAKFILPGV